MASGPFLIPWHTEPIPDFWAEWWAGAFGLAAAVVGLSSARGLPLPAVLALPALFLGVLLLQAASGRIVFPQLGLLYAAYLLWAGLLMLLGRSLADTLGLARLADVLAAPFLLGALCSAAIAIAQWQGVAAGIPWIFPKLEHVVYANLAQANNYSHYSWLGIVSAFYLFARGYLPRALLWLLVLPIAFGSVLTGSRSVFLYAFILLLVLVWAKRREPAGGGALPVVDAAILLPIIVVLSFVGGGSPDTAGSAATGPVATSGMRVYAHAAGPSVRMAIARSAWTAFQEHPWLGQGAGNFPWASFSAAAARPGDEKFQVAEHAHNFFLQCMAEFGAPAAAAAAVLLALWIIGFFRRSWQTEHFWYLAVLGIGATHALLEYPCWYAYFLGPTALLLGAADSGRVVMLAGRRARVYVILAVLGGAVTLAGLRMDYQVLETATNHPLAAHPEREQAWQISMERLLKIHRESLLSPWALLAFTNLAEPSRVLAQDRAALCERGIRLSPARVLVARCALQMAIAGRAGDAATLIHSVLRAYPAERGTTRGELETAARIYPEVRLLAMAARLQGGGTSQPLEKP